MAKILMQTTIADVTDDWHIGLTSGETADEPAPS